MTDLARDIERLKPAELTPTSPRSCATALYEIASTYGIPGPPDDSQLNLGVAALRRFLAAAPAHPKAVRAAYAIGAAYLARGKAALAYEAFTRFLTRGRLQGRGRRGPPRLGRAVDDGVVSGRRRSSRVSSTSPRRSRPGRAISPGSPTAPRAPTPSARSSNTQLLIAADHLERGHFAEARSAWTEFVDQNPLDERVPELLFQIGQTFWREKQFDRAIAAWETLAGKFPESEPAAHGQFEAASILETEKGDLAEAIERFKKIAVEPWKSQAQQRIAVMEAKHLLVVTPRTFRSGEAAHLKVTTRNIENLRFTAYKLNAEAYFRKKHDAGERRVARHRPGGARRGVDGRRSPATPDTSRSRRSTT